MVKTIAEIVAKNIRTRRLAGGMTQSELAEVANLNTISVNRIENGKRSPGPDTVESIARALKCSPEDLYRDPDAASQVETPTQSAMAQTIALMQQEIDDLRAQLESKPSLKRVAERTVEYESLSQEKRDLIALIPLIDDRLARSTLGTLRLSLNSADNSKDRRRS